MKGRTGYAIMTTAIAMLLLVVIYLAWSLFQFEAPRPTAHPLPIPPRPRGTTVTTEVTINVPPTPAAPQDGQVEVNLTATNRLTRATDSPVMLGGGPSGRIPAVCIHYGPAITTQAAFPGPVTHAAVMRRDGITFRLNRRPGDGTGEAE